MNIICFHINIFLSGFPGKMYILYCGVGFCVDKVFIMVVFTPHLELTSGMISAYVLTSVKSHGNIHDTMEQIKKISYLKSVSVVSGNHDLMIYVHVPSLNDLFDVTHQIQCHPMVLRTSTHVIEKEIQSSLN